MNWELIVITKNPSDYPNKFVVRRHAILLGRHIVSEDPIAVVDSLIDAREHVDTSTFAYLPRVDADDPVIFETWTRRLP